MDPRRELELLLTRRQLFGNGARLALGSAALAGLLQQDAAGAAKKADPLGTLGAMPRLHFPPKAKRIIYLHQSGGPAHIDLFDWKPKLHEHFDADLPDS